MSDEHANPPPSVTRKRTRKVAKTDPAGQVEALLGAAPSAAPTEAEAEAGSEAPNVAAIEAPCPTCPPASENAIGTLCESGGASECAEDGKISVADLALESALKREQNLASDIVNVAVHSGMSGTFPAETGEEYPGELDPTQEPPAYDELAQPESLTGSGGPAAASDLAGNLAGVLTDEADGEPEPSANSEAPADPRDLERTIEALLFAAMEPISVREMARAADSDSATIRKVVKALKETGDRERRPWDLVEVAGAYRFVTRAEFHPAIQRLKTQTSQRKLTQAALETLALIAYRQPIGRAEIESVRGVNAGPVLRLLLEKKLIQISGRGTGLGLPLLYGTTDYFLENFGLKNVNELPKPGEFKNA